MRSWLPLLVLCVLAAPAAAAPPDVLERGGEVLARDVAAIADPGAHDAAVDAFERSPEARTLRFQHALAGDVGMVDAPWVGTHNSFNSIAEMGPALSATDSNQQLGLVDQLRLGVRSLELDVHLWLGRPAVCHGQGAHAGCTIERSLSDVLAPVAAWLRAHPREVVLLYLEDHLDTAAGYDAGAKVVRDRLGDLLYAPRGKGCTQLPDALTRDDVAAAGAQVVVVSDCGRGSWSTVAHAWDRHGETRPVAFEGFPGCGPDFTRADYDTRLIRCFEDSTFVTTAATEVGAASRDDGLTPETTRSLARCGADLLGFDQLLPGDGRLEALVWSWAAGPPREGCAVTRASDGRWTAGSCAARRPAACRAGDGTWRLSRPATARTAERACGRAGGVFAAPRTAREQALLDAAAGGRSVLLGLHGERGAWRALDPRR